MKEEKIDRRVKMTKRLLKESLITLLRKKRISQITVKEICHDADVNRSTFYAHFKDLYELLEEIENDLIEEMVHYLYSYDMDRIDEAIIITEKLIEFIGANQEQCNILLSEQSGSSFEAKVQQTARQFLLNDWQMIPIVDKQLFDYVSSFIVSGSIQVVKMWLNNGRDKTPKEIAQLITDLINKGAPFNVI